MCETIALKKDYASATMAAAELAKRAAREAGWEWVTSDLNRLESQLSTLNKEISGFAADILTRDLKDIRKAHRDTTQVLLQELRRFLAAVTNPLRGVETQTKLILATQAARAAHA